MTGPKPRLWTKGADLPLALNELSDHLGRSSRKTGGDCFIAGRRDASLRGGVGNLDAEMHRGPANAIRASAPAGRVVKTRRA